MERTYLETVAGMVVEARKAKGWRPANLARAMGAKVTTVTRLEKGWHKPNERTLQRFEQALGIELPREAVPPKPAKAEPEPIDDPCLQAVATKLLQLFLPGRHPRGWEHLAWQASEVIAIVEAFSETDQP